MLKSFLNQREKMHPPKTKNEKQKTKSEKKRKSKKLKAKAKKAKKAKKSEKSDTNKAFRDRRPPRAKTQRSGEPATRQAIHPRKKEEYSEWVME
jgi:hypothetical protein